MSTFVRSTASKYKFGAHISGAGGISNSVTNAYNVGCNAFAMFLKSPRKWVSPAYTKEEIEKFKDNCSKCNYNALTDVLPHGQYFINLANPDEEKAQKAYDSFIDDLNRCEQLGIGHYNLHPGSSLKGVHETQLKQLASYLNRAINETKFVTILLENMAGTGNLIGSDLKDLKYVIGLVENKDRIGVCIDTCHTFAAGYDIGTQEAYEDFWKQFDETVGYQFLKGIHLNDSKAPLGANRDLHEKLGEGFLGLEVFRLIAHDERLKGLPIILETPQPNVEGYGQEVDLLEWLETISDPKNEELVEKNKKLQEQGSKSRKDQLTKYDAKQKKNTKRAKPDSKNDITQLFESRKKVTKKAKLDEGQED